MAELNGTAIKPKKPVWKRIIRLILILLLILVFLAVLLIGYLTFAEYRPAEEEVLEVAGFADLGEGSVPTKNLEVDKAITVLTWNIGYGALGDNANFFMDGGTDVITADEDRVNSNIANISSQIKYQNPDIIMLQEVDIDSDRSYRLDERTRIIGNFSDKAYTFATNFKVQYVPYPWPPIGRVWSGLVTMSNYNIDRATRVQLPVPFSWPVRIANLKRGLAIHRMPVEGSDKELVTINLHLEAYDNGEGKIAQTEALRKIMQEEYDKGNYVLVGGDFNQTFSSIDNSMYPLDPNLWQCGDIDTSTFGDEWQFIMDNAVPTCRSLDRPYVDADKENFQYYMIDGYIVSDNIEVVEVETKDIGFVYSDHNPVVMKIKLKQQ